MRILVIGGSRFVGPRLIKRLASRHRVTVFNRGRLRVSYPSGVQYVQGDRDQGFPFREQFDAVIDMCAYRGEQTARALQELDFDFLVHMSTAAVYQKSEVFPLTEGHALGDWPLWGEYNKGKVACERILQKSGVRYATLRPVYILGPANYCDREHFIYSRLKKGRPIVLPGNGQAVVQFVFADEVASALTLLAEKKQAGAFNCAGDEAITLQGLADEMGRIVGKKPILHYHSRTDGKNFNENEFPFANENFFCTNEKIQKLGVRFTPLLKGLKRDYEKYYKNAI